MVTVSAKAPTRIDLLGGTLDLWPLHQILRRKATINVGIDLYAQAEVKAASEYSLYSVDQDIQEKGDFAKVCGSSGLPLLGQLVAAIWNPEFGPISLRAEAKSPKGAGIGGSSCLAIAVAAALFRLRVLQTGEKEPSERELQLFVQDLEAKLLRIPTGCQDYWGALRGGLNIITFPRGKVEVETLQLQSLEALSPQLLLVYSGVSRCSGINNWQIFKNYLDGESITTACLEEIGELSEQAVGAVRAQNWRQLFSLSQKEWEVRKKLWPQIETSETKAIDQLAKRHGAYFSRVCGAGGGGVMVVFCEAGSKESLAQHLTSNGVAVLEAGFSRQGLVVSPDLPLQ